MRWKVAGDLRFRAAVSEPETPSFCGISGDLAPSTRKSLAIAIVRFWCAKKEKKDRVVPQISLDSLKPPSLKPPCSRHSKRAMSLREALGEVSLLVVHLSSSIAVAVVSWLSAPKSQRFLQFAIAMPIREHQKSLAISETLHRD